MKPPILARAEVCLNLRLVQKTWQAIRYSAIHAEVRRLVLMAAFTQRVLITVFSGAVHRVANW